MPRFVDSASASTARCSFGKTVDLIVMDQRRYRANQPCNDAVAPPVRRLEPAARLPRPEQMAYVKEQLKSSKAALEGDGQRGHDHADARCSAARSSPTTRWQGYPQEREELTTLHPRQQHQGRGLRHRRHPHVHHGRRAHERWATATPSRLEFVGGSVTSQGLGETDIDAGGGVTHQGQRPEPAHRPRRSSRRCAASTRG